MTKRVEVNILGRDFTISCPESEEENLQKSISYLKHKVEEIQKSGTVIGVDKTIIKAALDITHEFLNRGDDTDLHTLDYANKITNFNLLIDKALQKH
jgi:cell division protein ZapA